MAWVLTCRKHSFTCIHVCNKPSPRYLSGTVNTLLHRILTNIQLKNFFFLTWTIFKVLPEFITALLLFYVLFFWLQDTWDLSSLTRYWTCTLCMEDKIFITGLPGKSQMFSFFFIPKFSMHSGFTVPLTTLEKCAEIEALLSLLLWKGNRMEIMTLLEPGLRRASVSTSLEMWYSWCSLWRRRMSTIKAIAKVNSHSPRAPRLAGKSTLGTASCLLVPGRDFPGWMFWKHRFFYRCFHHRPQVNDLLACCCSSEPGRVFRTGLRTQPSQV